MGQFWIINASFLNIFWGPSEDCRIFHQKAWILMENIHAAHPIQWHCNHPLVVSPSPEMGPEALQPPLSPLGSLPILWNGSRGTATTPLSPWLSPHPLKCVQRHCNHPSLPLALSHEMDPVALVPSLSSYHLKRTQWYCNHPSVPIHMKLTQWHWCLGLPHGMDPMALQPLLSSYHGRNWVDALPLGLMDHKINPLFDTQVLN